MLLWSTTLKSIARWVAFSQRRHLRQRSRSVRERPGALRRAIARKAGPRRTCHLTAMKTASFAIRSLGDVMGGFTQLFRRFVLVGSL
jgi:hypothetical protein